MAITLSYGLHANIRPTDTNEAALLLAGASDQYCGLLRVCNQNSVVETYRIAHCEATGAASGSEWLAYDKEIEPNSTEEWTIYLYGSQELRIKASTADKISFHFSGEKKTTS